MLWAIGKLGGKQECLCTLGVSDRGDSGCDVVEFQVAHHEEKIGRSLSISKCWVTVMPHDVTAIWVEPYVLIIIVIANTYCTYRFVTL